MQGIPNQPSQFYLAVARIMSLMEEINETDAGRDLEIELKGGDELIIAGNGMDAFEVLAEGLRSGVFTGQNDLPIIDRLDNIVRLTRADLDEDVGHDEVTDMSYRLEIAGPILVFQAVTARHIFGIRHDFRR